MVDTILILAGVILIAWGLLGLLLRRRHAPQAPAPDSPPADEEPTD